MYRKYKNSKQTCFLDFSCHFLILYGIWEVREVSRNLPGARGFVVTEYQPVATHGDPTQTIFEILMKTKKMRDARTSRFQPVARRDLCYVSENKGFRFY